MSYKSKIEILLSYRTYYYFLDRFFFSISYNKDKDDIIIRQYQPGTNIYFREGEELRIRQKSFIIQFLTSKKDYIIEVDYYGTGIVIKTFEPDYPKPISHKYINMKNAY